MRMRMRILMQSVKATHAQTHGMRIRILTQSVIRVLTQPHAHTDSDAVGESVSQTHLRLVDVQEWDRTGRCDEYGAPRLLPSARRYLELGVRQGILTHADVR